MVTERMAILAIETRRRVGTWVLGIRIVGVQYLPFVELFDGAECTARTREFPQEGQ